MAQYTKKGGGSCVVKLTKGESVFRENVGVAAKFDPTKGADNTFEIERGDVFTTDRDLKATQHGDLWQELTVSQAAVQPADSE